MKKLLLVSAATCVAFSLAEAQFNPVNLGFETDGIADVVPSGWGEALSGATGVTSSAYVRSGDFSLMIDSAGAGGWASPNVFQEIAVTPGVEYSLSAYFLMPSTNPITDGSFGITKLEFYNDQGGIVEGYTPTTGVFAFGGVESRPQILQGSDTDTWIFTEAAAVAPAEATIGKFVLLNVNAPGAAFPLYVDDVSIVPEPSTYALMGGAIALGFMLMRRRRRS